MLALVPSSLALPLTSQGKLSAESLPSRAGKPSNELQQQSGILLPDFSWRAVGECEEPHEELEREVRLVKWILLGLRHLRRHERRQLRELGA